MRTKSHKLSGVRGMSGGPAGASEGGPGPISGTVKGLGWGLMAVIPAAGAIAPLWGLFLLAGVTGKTEHPYSLLAGFWLLLLWLVPFPITGALLGYGTWGQSPSGRKRAKRVALGLWMGIGVGTVLVVGGVLLLPRDAENSRVNALLALNVVATALVLVAAIVAARFSPRGQAPEARAR